jgi:hypothetical protein
LEKACDPLLQHHNILSKTWLITSIAPAFSILLQRRPKSIAMTSTPHKRARDLKRSIRSGRRAVMLPESCERSRPDKVSNTFGPPLRRLKKYGRQSLLGDVVFLRIAVDSRATFSVRFCLRSPPASDPACHQAHPEYSGLRRWTCAWRILR